MKTILLIAAVESFALFSLFLIWRFKHQYSRLPATLNARPTNAGLDLRSTDQISRDTSRWAFINSWRVMPQHDDRTPMSGDAIRGTATRIQRSLSRRRHQEKFKEWSQARHD